MTRLRAMFITLALLATMLAVFGVLFGLAYLPMVDSPEQRLDRLLNGTVIALLFSIAMSLISMTLPED